MICDVVLATNLIKLFSLKWIEKVLIHLKAFRFIRFEEMFINEFLCLRNFLFIHHCRKIVYSHEAGRPSKNLFRDHINYRISSLFRLLVFIFQLFFLSCVLFCRRSNSFPLFFFIFINFFLNFIFLMHISPNRPTDAPDVISIYPKHKNGPSHSKAGENGDTFASWLSGWCSYVPSFCN